MARMDVEGALIGYLAAHGFAAYGDRPDGSVQPCPDEFVTVERTGGRMEGHRDMPRVAVQSWVRDKEQGRARALELALAVDAVMPDFEHVRHVRTVTRDELYNFPDYSGGAARYQALYTIVTQDTED